MNYKSLYTRYVKGNVILGLVPLYVRKGEEPPFRMSTEQFDEWAGRPVNMTYGEHAEYFVKVGPRFRRSRCPFRHIARPRHFRETRMYVRKWIQANPNQYVVLNRYNPKLAAMDKITIEQIAYAIYSRHGVMLSHSEALEGTTHKVIQTIPFTGVGNIMLHNEGVAAYFDLRGKFLAERLKETVANYPSALIRSNVYRQLHEDTSGRVRPASAIARSGVDGFWKGDRCKFIVYPIKDECELYSAPLKYNAEYRVVTVTRGGIALVQYGEDGMDWWVIIDTEAHILGNLLATDARTDEQIYASGLAYAEGLKATRSALGVDNSSAARVEVLSA